MKRQRPEPKPYDWRDISMPVLRNYRMGDGTTKIEVDPDYEHRYREHLMSAAPHPKWYQDETYELRRRK